MAIIDVKNGTSYNSCPRDLLLLTVLLLSGSLVCDRGVFRPHQPGSARRGESSSLPQTLWRFYYL